MSHGWIPSKPTVFKSVYQLGLKETEKIPNVKRPTGPKFLWVESMLRKFLSCRHRLFLIAKERTLRERI